METRYANINDYNKNSFTFWNKGSWTKVSKWLENSKTYTIKVGSYLIASPSNSKTVSVKTIPFNKHHSKTVKSRNGNLGTKQVKDATREPKDPFQVENSWMSPKRN